jgi:ribosomal-protein-alanine N-acetyltransferase
VTDEQLRAEMGRPWSRLWVMRESGTGVVAFAVAWHIAEELHVLNIATRTDCRRRGIARALLAEVVKYARTERIDHVLLEVRRSNRAAIALYRAAGFFAMGLRRRYYPDDEDALEMVLRLDPNTREILPHADEVRLES